MGKIALSKKGSRFAKRKPIGLSERDTIVIATEGEKTEPDYSIYLQRRFREIIVDIVPRDYSRSDPMQVLDDLIDYIGQESPGRNNAKAHMIVIDNDGRPPEVMDEVITKATENCVSVADSNPCFELWLLFHRKPLSDYDDNEIVQLQRNEKTGTRTRMEAELVKVCGEYNKNDLRASDLPSLRNNRRQ